jgi:hypothetical protein
LDSIRVVSAHALDREPTAVQTYGRARAMQQAEAFANRVTKESGPDVPKQVHRAFELIFQRPPTVDEQRDAASLARTHGLPTLCRALFNSNEFIRLN